MSESVESGEVVEGQVLDLNDAMEAELSRPFEWPLAQALAHEAGQVELAGAVLKTLGLVVGRTIPIANSLRDEAGAVEVADKVFDRIEENAFTMPIGSAIASEAGQVELVEAVFETLGIEETQLAVGVAIAEEAGAIDLASAVNDAITTEERFELSAGIGDAIRAAAGDVGDLWPAIVSEIAGDEVGATPLREALAHEAGEADLVHRVMDAIERDSLGVVTELPAPANTARWGFAAVIAFAAAAMVMFSVRLTISELPLEPVSPPLQFAAAGEMVVHDLEYSENVQVFQVEGDEGAMIIWVDEEAVL